MDPVLLIGRYPYSHWVLGARPGGIESYRPLPQLGVPPCDRGNIGDSPWLLRFVTEGLAGRDEICLSLPKTFFGVVGVSDSIDSSACLGLLSRSRSSLRSNRKSLLPFLVYWTS